MTKQPGQLLIPIILASFVIISMLIFSFVVVKANNEEGTGRPLDVCTVLKGKLGCP